MTPRTRTTRLLAPLSLFALAFAARALSWPRVAGGDPTAGFHLFGPDSYYHMRRVLYTLAEFPSTLSFDPYINFPHGGQPIWSPAFDFAVALVCWPFYTAGDALSAERIAIWIPPLLGAATVVALHRLVRRHFDAQVALASAAILALLSGHAWYSQIGFVDHHAAVALIATLLLGVTLDGLRATREAPSVAWGQASATGATMALLLLVWPGGLLHVGITQGVLAASWMATRGELSRRRALHSTAANLVALVLVLPFTLDPEWSRWSHFSPAVLGYFQPWLFSALALHAGLGAVAGGPSRVLAGLGAACAIGAASLLAMPGLGTALLDAAQWLFKQETFQAIVSESRPLFSEQSGSRTRVAEARLSRFVYLYPLALGALAWLSRKHAGRETMRTVLLFGLVLAGVTLLQKRFFNSASVALALVMGWALVETTRWLQARVVERRGGARGARTIAWLATSSCALWLLAPSLATYRVPLQNSLERLQGRPVSLPQSLVRQRAFRRAALWLRDHSAPTSGLFDSEGQPEYGVMALWAHGHLIEYVAQRPSVADNFGDDLGPENFLASYHYFEAEPARAARILEQLRVRYVLFRTVLPAELSGFDPASMNHRLTTGWTHGTAGVRGLKLVYDQPIGMRGDPSRIRIFEAVPDL